MRINAGLLLCLFSGCAAMPSTLESRKAAEPRSIVLVVDGSGGFQSAARSVVDAVEESKAPIHVCSFDWTHGRGRVVADMMDVDHARAQGRELAQKVRSLHAAHPETPIVLVAHSAGSMVALSATKELPPDSVERIVLLAPAVAADHDLKPALLASRRGVDVFYSERDRICLGLGTLLMGTADGERSSPPAGRVGFRVPQDTPPAQLRQHKWEPAVADTGNLGDHWGTLQPAYMRAHVLPLLQDDAPVR